MLKTQTSWRAHQDRRARKHLAEIQTTVAALSDDDLLDLADIFDGAQGSILNKIAVNEMTRRGISL